MNEGVIRKKNEQGSSLVLVKLAVKIAKNKIPGETI
jgi:hypothetical protein